MLTKILSVWRSRKPDERKSNGLDRKTIVCPCHDATLYDLNAQWEAGYQHPETLKRATAVFMGPCQGKMCGKVAGDIIANLQGDAFPNERRPSVRPPLYPVRMGDLVETEGNTGGVA